MQPAERATVHSPGRVQASRASLDAAPGLRVEHEIRGRVREPVVEPPRSEAATERTLHSPRRGQPRVCCGLGERRCESLSWTRPRTCGRPYSRGSAAKRGSPRAMHGRPSRPKKSGDQKMPPRLRRCPRVYAAGVSPSPYVPAEQEVPRPSPRACHQPPRSEAATERTLHCADEVRVGLLRAR